MHPYLKERLRDLRTHGFCVLEHQLIIEDETIWGGYAVDDFNAKVYEILDGEVYTDEKPNGDIIVRKPKDAKEQLELIVDAKNAINDQANQKQHMNPHGFLI